MKNIFSLMMITIMLVSLGIIIYSSSLKSEGTIVSVEVAEDELMDRYIKIYGIPDNYHRPEAYVRIYTWDESSTHGIIYIKIKNNGGNDWHIEKLIE